MFAFFYHNLQARSAGYTSKGLYEIRIAFIDVKWSSNFRKGLKKVLDFNGVPTLEKV